MIKSENLNKNKFDDLLTMQIPKKCGFEWHSNCLNQNVNYYGNKKQ